MSSAGLENSSSRQSDEDSAGHGAIRDGGPDEAADYIAGAAADLAAMAQRHGLKTLAFLLDMARLEAEEHVRLRLLRDPR